MTKKEYVQSLKDKGVKKAEALELLNQWDIDNKPIEVEKTEVVAEDAAPVTAASESSTDSTSENGSLEQEEIKDIELPEENKPVEVKGIDYSKSEFNNLNFFDKEIEQPEPEVEQTKAEVEVKIEEPKQNVVEQEESTSIENDIVFDLKEKNWNDQERLNKIAKKNNLESIILLDNMTDEAKEQYIGGQDQELIEKIKLNGNEHVGYAEVKTISDNVTVADYENPDMISMLNPELKSDIDADEQTVLQQEKFVKIKEANQELSNEISNLTEKLNNTSDPVEKKMITNSINELQIKVRNNNKDLNVQFAPPTINKGTGTIRQYAPVFKNSDGKLYVSKATSFKSNPLPEVIADTENLGRVRITEEYENNANRELAELQTSRINEARNQGKDRVNIPRIDEIKTDDIRDPKQLLDAIFKFDENGNQFDEEIMYDFLNASGVPADLKQNASAKLFNETFSLYGFYAIEGPGNTLRIYNRPEFKPMFDKNGDLITEPSYLDISTQQAEIDEDWFGEYFEVNINTNDTRSFRVGRQSNFLGLKGPFARGTKLIDHYDNISGEYEIYSQPEFQKLLKDGRGLYKFMNKALESNKDANGNYYIDEDNLRVSKTPSAALVKATELQADDSQNAILENKKVIAKLEKDIKKEQKDIEKDAEVIKNVTSEVEKLSTNDKYNSSNNKLKELNSSIEEKNNRIIEINSEIEKLNPEGKKEVDEETFNKIKPLIDEYRKLDLDIKSIQQEAQPLIDVVGNESKAYRKAYDKYKKAGGKEYQADLVARQIANQENFNVNMSTLVAQSMYNEDLIEDAQRDLMTSTSTFLDWAENTEGRGSILGYTINRAGKGIVDISKGLGGYVFDLIGAAESLASDNPEEARKYWDNAKKQIRANADENWRRKWKDHDTDEFYTKNFEESDVGQAYGVMLDMLVDFGFGFIGTGGAGAVGFGLASGMRISEGIEQEIDQLEEESQYKRNPDGSFVYKLDKDGDPVIKDGKPVKIKNPDYKPLSANEKLAYKSAIVVASTVLEKVGFSSFSGIGKTKLASYVLGRVLKSGKKLNPYTLKKLVQRETKDLVSRGFFKFTSGVGGEIITEISQDGVEMIAKNVANSWRDGSQFDFFDPQKLNKQTFERWWETAKITAYATAPLSGIGGGISMIQKNNLEKSSAKNIAAFSAYAKTPELRKAFIKQQQLLLDQGKIEQSDYDSRVETLSQVAGILESYNKVDLSSKANKTVLQLELEIANLKKNTNENKAASKLSEEAIKERELAIEQVIEQDQKNGGGKAERLQTKINKSKLVENVESQSGKEVVIVTDENRGNIVDEYQLTEEQQEDFNNGGLYISKNDGPTVMLIDEKAAENVIIHEDRHDFLAEVLANPKNENAAFALAGLLEGRLDKLPNTPNNLRAKAKIQLLKDKYREDDNYTASMLAEEMIMFFGDALGDKSSGGLFKMDLKESGFQKIKNNFKRIYRDALNIDVKIKNDQDLIDLIRDHRRAIETGKVSKRLQRVRDGQLDLDAKLLEDADDTRRVKQAERKEEVDLIRSETDQDASTSDVKMAASKDLDIKQTLDTIVQNPDGTRKFDTKDDFKDDSVALFQAYDAIQNTNLLDGRIKQDIGNDKNLSEAISLAENPEEVKNDIVRKVKENLAVRAIKNFDPSKNESLFGYMLGKRPLTIEALKDIKKEYVKNVGSRGGNVRIDQQTQEGGSLDFEDTGIDIEGQVDKGIEKAPRSTFRRGVVRGSEKGLTNQEVKSFKETAEPLIKKLPDVDAKNYRTKVNQVAGPALKKWVNENIFKGNWGRQFILDNYNNIRDLGIDYLIDLDKGLQKQGKPRIFTEFNKKLTTQAEIRKYRDSGRAFVENEAQGVSLYDIKNPGPETMADFFLNDTASNNSNRKGKLMEAYGKKMFKDLMPETRAKQGDTDQVRATSARKTQVQPNLLFNKGFSAAEVNDLVLVAEASDINAAGVASGIPKGSITVNDSNRKQKQKSILQNIKDFKLSLNVFESSMPASAGAVRTRVGDISAEGNKLKRYLESNPNLKAVDGDVWYRLTDGSFAKGFDKKRKGPKGKKDFGPPVNKEGKPITNLVADRGKLYYGTSDPAYKEAYEAAKENTSKNALVPKKVSVTERIKKAFIEKFKSRSNDNMKVLEEVAYELDDAVKNGMPKENAALIIAQGYQATSGLIKISAPFTDVSSDFDYGPEGTKQGNKKKRPFIEEHNPPASTIGGTLIWAISNNKTREVFPFIKKNYYQTQLSKADDYLLDMAKLDKRLPKGTSILNDSIIRLSEAGINVNKIIDPVSGRSRADIFGLGVAESVNEIPGVIAKQKQLIREVVVDGLDIKTAKKRLDVYVKFPDNGQPSLAKTQNDATKVSKNITNESGVVYQSKDISIEEVLSKAVSLDEALKNSRDPNAPVKKIRVFDFDDTLARTKSNVLYTMPDGSTGKLTAEEFAEKGEQLKNEGAEWDFSEFNKVMNGKKGPLFEVAQKIQETRGTEDMFVLTARAAEAEFAIKEFLDGIGLDIPLKNITGLGNSTGAAKANWIVDKAADGYNDFYFVDDHMANVNAVKNALSVIDIKSKVQQAKIQQSKNLDNQFNKLLEETTGVEFYKEYSPAKAKTKGANKGRFKFFIPHSAEDFLGLIYPTLGKGSIGDAQMAWYKTHLLDPYTRAQENLSAARLNLMNDFKQLKKSLNVPKNLRKKNSTGMTNEQAVRVYLFQSMGYETPGLSKTDLKELQSVVENDPQLREFAEQILTITKGDGYAKPRETWLTGTITTDLIDLINTEKRAKYLAEWQENADAIYSKENLNKLEAIYGTKYREALEGILSRMKSGRNRLDTGSRLSNKILDYINGSVGTIMFFNTRSAVLQTISAINFLNWNFNNPLMAGKAFANQPQYWSDFAMLMNSDYLKDRRNGLKLNISESEIADAASTSKNKSKAVLNYILQKGYLPTQYADSFAIASGGATFYRNRVNDLIKNENKTKSEAEAQALIEWRQIAETSQQSSDPSKISAQQSSNLGRVILAFANTPMQYARIQKRAIQDLANGRGDAKTHVSKIIYYGVLQNIIFNALQQAVYAIGFGDDDDEEFENKKYLNTANGMLDSMLRGLGIGGAAVSVGKNFLMDIYERSGRDRPEYVDAVWKLMQFSPPISSKISKLKQAAWYFDSKKRRQVIFDKGFALDNPAYEAFAKVVSATTNVPIDRLFYKMKNIEGALNEDNDTWQRIAMLAGWPKWQLEPSKSDSELEDTRRASLSPEQREKEDELKRQEKEKAKAAKAVQAYKSAKGSTDYDTIKKLTSAQQIKMLKGLGYGEYTIKNAKSEKAKIDLIIHKNKGGKIKIDKKAVDTAKYKALSKADQVRKLDSLGLSKADIAALKYEKDRVAKLLELMK